MIKFFIFNLLIVSQLYALDVKITWTGVAGILIEDKETSIGIDLLFTRPSLKHWLFNAIFTSDESLVLEKIRSIPIKKINALFASHTHFDHAVDLPFLGYHFQATLYASTSLTNLTKSYNQLFQRNVQSIPFIAGVPITIGSFKITAFPRTHSAIIQSIQWHFLEGTIATTNGLKFYDYLAGETWNYLIEHPSGNIYFDQSGTPDQELLSKLPPIDTAVLGVANKKSIEDWIEGYGKTLKPKKIIPTHHDWFLLNFPKTPFTLWGSDIPALKQELQKLSISLVL